MHSEKLTLANICEGAVQEQVNRALEQVAKNILDPNTDPTKKRTITLKMTLKPDDYDPEDVVVDANVSVTLAPEEGVSTRLYVNKDLTDGSVSVMEHKKGEIRGQLDFSDVWSPNKHEDEIPEEQEEMNEEPAKILDLRKKA